MDIERLQTLLIVLMGGFILFLGARLINRLRQYKPLMEDEIEKAERRKAALPRDLQQLEIETPEPLEENSKPQANSNQQSAPHQKKLQNYSLN